jgi:hypothetical protein
MKFKILYLLKRNILIFSTIGRNSEIRIVLFLYVKGHIDKERFQCNWRFILKYRMEIVKIST